MYLYYIIFFSKCNSEKFRRNSESAETFYFVGQSKMTSETILITVPGGLNPLKGPMQGKGANSTYYPMSLSTYNPS